MAAGYSNWIVIAPSGKALDPERAERLARGIREHTHHTLSEARRLAASLGSGQTIEFLSRNSSDPDDNFRLAALLRGMGLAANAICVALTDDLPYLVAADGKVAGSEPASRRSLDEDGCEELLAAMAPIVTTGYHCRMDWIHPPRSLRVWPREFKPQIIDDSNTMRRDDYPLYHPEEWLARDGQRYLFLWMLH